MNTLLSSVQNYLNENIPITQELGVTVQSFNGYSITIKAPLVPNINHRETVFGGSLVSVAILAGWTILHLKMQKNDIKARLVIQHSTMSFLEPVDDDFIAECSLDLDMWEKFKNMLSKKGKSRITLLSRIWKNDILAGEHHGIYVAIKL